MACEQLRFYEPPEETAGTQLELWQGAEDMFAEAFPVVEANQMGGNVLQLVIEFKDLD